MHNETDIRVVGDSQAEKRLAIDLWVVFEIAYDNFENMTARYIRFLSFSTVIDSFNYID